MKWNETVTKQQVTKQQSNKVTREEVTIIVQHPSEAYYQVAALTQGKKGYKKSGKKGYIVQGEAAISFIIDRPGKMGRRRRKLSGDDMQYTTSEQAICASPSFDDHSLYDKFLKEGTITVFKMRTLCNIFIKDVGTGENKNDNDNADDSAEHRRACNIITSNVKDTFLT
eukprot:6362224-Ditylum_brightwellii.AAC.1